MYLHYNYLSYLFILYRLLVLFVCFTPNTAEKRIICLFFIKLTNPYTLHNVFCATLLLFFFAFKTESNKILYYAELQSFSVSMASLALLF